MTGAAEIRRRQEIRAWECARALTGGRVSHGLYRAMLDLVVSVERPALAVQRPPGRKGRTGEVPAAQEGLW